MSDIFNNTKRTVICDDALNWLPIQNDINVIITSLPDADEIGLNQDEWGGWIEYVCLLLDNALNSGGIIIFYQTNRKYKGTIIDKKHIISQHFLNNGYHNIYDKIVLKQKPDTVNWFRPTFTNMFGFSRIVKSGRATPDVMYAGKMIYKNAMGINACKNAINFISDKIKTDTITDPFCGRGSVLKIANDMGYNSVGVEILKEQCIKAKTL